MTGAFTIKHDNPPGPATYLGKLWNRTSELVSQKVGPYNETETIIVRA